MREVIEKFDFDNTISKLDESGLIFQVLERFKNVDLHPDKVDKSQPQRLFDRRFFYVGTKDGEIVFVEKATRKNGQITSPLVVTRKKRIRR